MHDVKVHLEAVTGNIVEQNDIGAIVNAANAQLQPGGGVAGAVHRAAGPELERACRQFAPIKPGEAVITPAFDLPNDYVIHCLGPVYGHDHPEAKLLADCYRNAIIRAEEKKILSVAFPAISTGAFAYPLDEAAEIAVQTVKHQCAQTRHLTLVRFVLFSKSDREIYLRKLRKYDK
ncbi:MAG: macro domain-containing protein [Candidatus Marinimicrobia bacterium]|nr:macro domain-containing protein [Candidatus Neomarinimicrobiota bacterium]